MEKVTKRVNFSTQEKEELISLVSKYRDIIENKKTNDETVLEIINCKTVVGLDNPYDDESVLDKSLFVVTETENQIEDCTHVEFQSSQFSVSDNSTFIRPKTDNILNCKQLTNICEDSQDGDNKPKAKQQKNKCKIPSNDPPKIVDLKAQYLGYQIEEMKERLEIKKEERAFQAKLQALQIKQKEVELEIMLQQKRKLMFENEALENEIKKKL
ncbi:uncharacterized protein [Diabrotica undecimpunctata]|uniref:uncharacterized protein n=1 Tax=Diabrotica undecimpunctata TaxID=50387 RepID=UPI003B635DD9